MLFNAFLRRVNFNRLAVSRQKIIFRRLYIVELLAYQNFVGHLRTRGIITRNKSAYAFAAAFGSVLEGEIFAALHSSAANKQHVRAAVNTVCGSTDYIHIDKSVQSGYTFQLDFFQHFEFVAIGHSQFELFEFGKLTHFFGKNFLHALVAARQKVYRLFNALVVLFFAHLARARRKTLFKVVVKTFLMRLFGVDFYRAGAHGKREIYYFERVFRAHAAHKRAEIFSLVPFNFARNRKCGKRFF